ncbi:hypothetical protein K458DRAFT_393929 [Lentithecium fluviatile CBS 122367]|uniref:Methyltransferase domain-containing protein n=1 Tax=Lentithecium fluviatile CBS 122367 TaxID=1168545 RepID=A0A6G1INF0_9PLEO|nr:hypothetical protein K458DRAFT_393929 [Lentithecium fluviatile CBS 122367]
MTSCITPIFAASSSTKIVPYVPKPSKSKPKNPKSKAMPIPGAKPLATAETVEQRRSEVDSEDDGERFRIEGESAMPDWNGWLPGLNEASGASHLVDPADMVGNFGAAPELEKPEHHQPGQQSLVGGGTDHVIGVTNRNSALIRPFDGSNVSPSNRVLEYQASSPHAAAVAEQDPVGQYRDLNAPSMHALSDKEDHLLFDVTSRSPLIRKRTHCLSDTIISSAEAPDIPSGLEPNDSRSMKRRRLSNQEAESLILDHLPTPKPIPLPTPNSPDCRSGVNSEPSPGPFDIDSQGGGVGSPVPSQNDLEEENGNDGTRGQEIVKELPHSPRQSSSSEEAEGDQYINMDSDRRKKNREGRGGEVGERHNDEANQLDKVSRRALAKTSQRRKRTVFRVQERCRGSLQASPRRRDRRAMPTRASRQVTSSRLQQLSAPRMDIATQSPGTKAGDGSNINYGSSANMSHQITDLTRYPVLKGSLIVAIVRNCNLKRLLDPAALGYKFLGKEGKVIRTIQLSPDSWILVRYRHDDDASGLCTRGSSNANWISSSCSDAANHATGCSSSSPWSKDDKNEEDCIEHATNYSSSPLGMKMTRMKRKASTKTANERTSCGESRMKRVYSHIEISRPSPRLSIMPTYSTPADVNDGFGHLVGMLEYSCAHTATVCKLAIQSANLRTGDNVLDIGTGYGEVLALAKPCIGSGMCVGVDAVNGFLQIDTPFRLQRSQLYVAPKVHLLLASATHANLHSFISNRLQHRGILFNAIFAIQILPTIPPDQRAATLKMWTSMLAPGGRLFVTMTGRFGTSGPSASCPIQFASCSELAEIPGCVIGFYLHPSARTATAGGNSVPVRIPIMTLQLSPDRMWDVARAQVSDAAISVGLTVTEMHNIGNGTGLTLAASANGP